MRGSARAERGSYPATSPAVRDLAGLAVPPAGQRSFSGSSTSGLAAGFEAAHLLGLARELAVTARAASAASWSRGLDAGESDMRWVISTWCARAACRRGSARVGDAFGAPGDGEGGDPDAAPRTGEATLRLRGSRRRRGSAAGAARGRRSQRGAADPRRPTGTAGTGRARGVSATRSKTPPGCSSEGFDPFREREVETWLTVANGHTGTRGSIEEGSAASTPATFVAGVFGDGTSDPLIREPVPAPDWRSCASTWRACRSTWPTARSSSTSACTTCVRAWCSATGCSGRAAGAWSACAPRGSPRWQTGGCWGACRGGAGGHRRLAGMAERSRHHARRRRRPETRSRCFDERRGFSRGRAVATGAGTPWR